MMRGVCSKSLIVRISVVKEFKGNTVTDTKSNVSFS